MAVTVLATHMAVSMGPYGSFEGKEQTEAVVVVTAGGSLVPHMWIRAVVLALAFVLTSCWKP